MIEFWVLKSEPLGDTNYTDDDVHETMCHNVLKYEYNQTEKLVKTCL
jgi:hypothetical protein